MIGGEAIGGEAKEEEKGEGKNRTKTNIQIYKYIVRHGDAYKNKNTIGSIMMIKIIMGK